MGFARGFRKKYFSNAHANELNRAQAAKNRAGVDSLLSAVEENLKSSKIDKQSAGEIQTMLGFGEGSTAVDYNTAFKNVTAANDYLAKAIEGIDPKFKARRQTELLYKTMVDQPGRKQFVFGAGNSSRRSGNTGLLGA